MTAGLEILNLHAQGGMAEVYRARARDESGRSWYYAVKRMLPELLTDPEMMRMFIEEQRIAACLEHDNIVRVYDVAQAEGAGAQETFIVMEFLEGRDLSEVIEAASLKEQTLPVWFCIHVAREVLKALHYAATEARDKSGRVLGLIHRDISPHNIFICKDGQVKLTDFGVAKVETAEVRTKAGIIKGKFGYMSPEQLMAGKLDFRSDLYNVGILLYEALTAERLFFGESATQFIAAMMQNEVPRLDPSLLVPPELEELMRRSLAKKREDRPQTAAAFEASLAAIAESYGLVAQRGHVVAELTSQFPNLDFHEPMLQAPPRTEPEPEPEPEPAPASQASPVTTQVKHLTMVSRAPIPALTGGSASAEEPVFTSSRPRPVPPRIATDSGRNPRPAGAPARPEPKQPTARSEPSPRRPVTASNRAAALPPDPDDGDDLVPTLVEVRPDLDALGLRPDDDLPSADGEFAATEPTRLPAHLADPPSTTAPQRSAMRPSVVLPAADAEEFEASASTAENTRPAALHPERPTTGRSHRVSTGSRRVISLADDEDTTKKR